MKEILNQQARLVILRSLTECRGEANDSMLQSCLDVYGVKVSRDEVRTQQAWLAEQGLVTNEDIAGCIVSTLTGRGQDVAEGRAVVPGVKKPRIGG
ncbi:VpaChn25_0724 family phage protein [Citrobacter braakii]|uniref:VpaChn25_0724 family phage protein n=1 Tax=Citrobacter braakii TaxID=57706 RepID=UPI00403A64F6